MAGFTFNDNATLNFPKPWDDREGFWDDDINGWNVYPSVEVALESLTYRYIGQEIPLINEGRQTTFWFVGGTEDENFEEKTPEIPVPDLQSVTDIGGITDNAITSTSDNNRNNSGTQGVSLGFWDNPAIGGGGLYFTAGDGQGINHSTSLSKAKIVLSAERAFVSFDPANITRPSGLEVRHDKFSALRVYGWDSDLMANYNRELQISQTDFKVIDSLYQIGLSYDDDYSVNGKQNPRWIPDWGTVDDHIQDTVSGYVPQTIQLTLNPAAGIIIPTPAQDLSVDRTWDIGLDPDYTGFTNYYTISEVDDEIQQALVGYATEEWVTDAIEAIPTPTLQAVTNAGSQTTNVVRVGGIDSRGISNYFGGSIMFDSSSVPSVPAGYISFFQDIPYTSLNGATRASIARRDGHIMIQSAGGPGGMQYAQLDTLNLTGVRTYAFPDESGTIALLSDIPVPTLQSVTDVGNSTTNAIGVATDSINDNVVALKIGNGNPTDASNVAALTYNYDIVTSPATGNNGLNVELYGTAQSNFSGRAVRSLKSVAHINPNGYSLTNAGGSAQGVEGVARIMPGSTGTVNVITGGYFRVLGDSDAPNINVGRGNGIVIPAPNNLSPTKWSTAIGINVNNAAFNAPANQHIDLLLGNGNANGSLAAGIPTSKDFGILNFSPADNYFRSRLSIGTPDFLGSEMLRVNGTVSVATPTADDHAATKEYVDAQSVIEALNEGSGIGYRIRGRNPNNYGNIGVGAVDFSSNSVPSSTRGATGSYSSAFGSQTTASGNYSAAFGNSTTASGYASLAFGNGTTANEFASLSIGRFSTDGAAETSWIPGSPIFKVGNGTNSVNRSNAYVLYNDGTSTQYGVASYGSDYSANFTDRSLVDKEYVDGMPGFGLSYNSTSGKFDWGEYYNDAALGAGVYQVEIPAGDYLNFGDKFQDVSLSQDGSALLIGRSDHTELLAQDSTGFGVYKASRIDDISGAFLVNYITQSGAPRASFILANNNDPNQGQASIYAASNITLNAGNNDAILSMSPGSAGVTMTSAGDIQLFTPSGAVRASQLSTSGLVIHPTSAPASSTAAGTAGEVRITEDYVYVCIDTNTWRRIPLENW